MPQYLQFADEFERRPKTKRLELTLIVISNVIQDSGLKDDAMYWLFEEISSTELLSILQISDRDVSFSFISELGLRKLTDR